jgi:hypothetical protein
MLRVDNPERHAMVIPLVLLVAAATASSLTPPSLDHLRGVSSRETALLRDLVARSATAGTLAARIESEAVIVYVEITTSMPRGRGATRLAATTPLARFIRITIAPVAHPDDQAALLAHELQHAVEIARAPDVKSSDDIRRLYRAIGEDRAATVAFETVAAQEVGARVRLELSRNPALKTQHATEMLRDNRSGSDRIDE